jgi:hypothetical protein
VRPKTRVKAAKWLLAASMVLMLITVFAYLLKLINDAMLLLINLILSFVAIALTCADILSTSDVRNN